MIIKAGKSDYPLKDFGQLHSATIRKDDIIYALAHMHIAEFDRIKCESERNGREFGAMPVYFTVLRGAMKGEDDILLLYPPPDQDYEVNIAYYPAIRML